MTVWGGGLVSSKRRTMMLGVFFLFFLALAYFENESLLSHVRYIFADPPLAIALVFLHNVAAVSIIILGMTFYVEFVLTFLPKGKSEYVVLHHPLPFALVFTAIILIVSILRVSILLWRQPAIDALSIIMLISLPHGVAEGYGIFQSIYKTLKKSITLRDLTIIYSIFLLAAILEVGLVQALLWVSFE